MPAPLKIVPIYFNRPVGIAIHNDLVYVTEHGTPPNNLSAKIQILNLDGSYVDHFATQYPGNTGIAVRTERNGVKAFILNRTHTGFTSLGDPDRANIGLRKSRGEGTAALGSYALMELSMFPGVSPFTKTRMSRMLQIP